MLLQCGDVIATQLTVCRSLTSNPSVDIQKQQRCIFLFEAPQCGKFTLSQPRLLQCSDRPPLIIESPGSESISSTSKNTLVLSSFDMKEADAAATPLPPRRSIKQAFYASRDHWFGVNDPDGWEAQSKVQ